MHLTELKRHDKINSLEATMELYDLKKQFGTEKQCREYIANLRWQNGYRCPRCQSSKAWKTSELKYKCQNCGYKASVTVGTIFQDSHVPLPIWFKAIWYISSKPNDITASELQKDIGVGSNRTALLMFHKIKSAMICSTLDKLQGTVEVVVKDIRVFNKNVFIATAVEIDNRKIGRIRMKTISRENPMELVDFIDECIEGNSTIVYNLPVLANLLFCENYIFIKKPYTYSFSKTQRVINIMRNWLSDNYIKGELTSYLNEFCMRVNSLKTKIEFYDLLKNVITLDPLAGKSKPFGIKI